MILSTSKAYLGNINQNSVSIAFVCEAFVVLAMSLVSVADFSLGGASKMAWPSVISVFHMPSLLCDYVLTKLKV